MLKRRFSVSASGIPLEALIFDHLTLELPRVTKTELILTISMQYNENKEKYQFGDQ